MAILIGALPDLVSRHSIRTGEVVFGMIDRKSPPPEVPTSDNADDNVVVGRAATVIQRPYSFRQRSATPSCLRWLNRVYPAGAVHRPTARCTEYSAMPARKLAPPMPLNCSPGLWMAH